MCGRRFGKTTLGIYLLGRKVIRDGTPVAWFAPTYKLLADPWREAQRTLRGITKSINVQERRIEIINGASVDFWSLDNEDPARGRKYGEVVIDEAGIVRNLASAWSGAIRPTLADYQGGAWFLGTPKGYGDFSTLFAKAKQHPDQWAAFRKSTRDNPYIPPAEIEEMRRDMPPEAFRQEVEGEPVDGGTNPFGVDAIRRLIGPLSGRPAVAYGVDLAQSEDWSVVIGLDDAGAVSVFERWRRLPWPETMQRVAALIGSTPALVDRTGVGAPIVEDLARKCPNVAGFTFTRPSKQQLMGGLTLAIQRGELRYPTGPIVDELESFETTYSASGTSYSAPPGLHDDCVCALALANAHMDRARRPVVASIVTSTSTPSEAETERLADERRMAFFNGTDMGNWQ